MGVGTAENGFAIRISRVAASSTSACASWSRSQAARTSGSGLPDSVETSAAVGARPSRANSP